MIVIADTSPLNYLVLLGKAETLASLYGRVIAPSSVIAELCHPDAPIIVRSWASSVPSWIEIRSASHIDSTLAIDLGTGERDAISLALELGADLLLIDERAGRDQAKTRQLSVTGTLGVLLRASHLGLVDFPSALTQLERLGFRVSPAIKSALLSKYREG